MKSNHSYKLLQDITSGENIMKKTTKQTVVRAAMYSLMALSLVVLPNCAKYHGKPLKYPNNGHTQEIKNVSVTTKKLSPHETKTYFDSKKLGKKYNIIQLYINNKSTHTLALNANNTSLSVVPKNDIYKKIKYNTTLREILYPCITILSVGVGGVFGIVTGLAFWGYKVLDVFPVISILTAFAAPIVIAGTTTATDYSRARKANKIITKDLAIKIFGKDDKLIIYPSHISNKVIFAHKNKLEPQKSFSLKLVTQDNSEYATFDCKI